MSEAKFTPGPWSLWDGCSWRRFGSDATQQIVVEPIVYSERDRHPDLRVSKEDAALICAAPDLLAACEAAERCIVPLSGFMGGGQYALNMIRAAIAKATEATP